jgi:hypothetical protein
MLTEKQLKETLDRLSAQEVIVRFGVDEYICDTLNQEFTRRGGPFNCISFDLLVDFPNDCSSYLLYDQKVHGAADISDLNFNVPKHILLIQLPPVALLDPVSFAIWYKKEGRTTSMNEDEFLFKIQQIKQKLLQNRGLKTVRQLSVSMNRKIKPRF